MKVTQAVDNQGERHTAIVAHNPFFNALYGGKWNGDLCPYVMDALEAFLTDCADDLQKEIDANANFIPKDDIEKGIECIRKAITILFNEKGPEGDYAQQALESYLEVYGALNDCEDQDEWMLRLVHWSYIQGLIWAQNKAGGYSSVDDALAGHSA